MKNPFHPDSLDPIGKSITILKGDTPGHEFHGNQWTDGKGNFKDAHLGIHKVAEGAIWSDKNAGKITPTVASLTGVAKLHGAIAREMERTMYDTSNENAWAASDVHNEVSRLAEDLASNVAAGGKVTPDEMAELKDKINEGAFLANAAYRELADAGLEPKAPKEIDPKGEYR